VPNGRFDYEGGSLFSRNPGQTVAEFVTNSRRPYLSPNDHRIGINIDIDIDHLPSIGPTIFLSLRPLKKSTSHILHPMISSFSIAFARNTAIALISFHIKK
jgi:hypothetical protein